MLSRVKDTRVFESSEDVIITSTGRHRHRGRAQQHLEAQEDEELHPQHPYRMRRRVLQQENGEFNASVGQEEQDIDAFSRRDQQPMQFVFLSSGEIRAREDCPPGLELPKLQHRQHFTQAHNPRLQYQEGESDAESDSEEEADRRQHIRVGRQKTAGQPRRTQRMAASPSSSSSSLASSESDDAGVSSDEERDLAASRLSDAGGNQETEAREQRRQGTRNAEHQDRDEGRGAARNGVKRTPTQSLKLDHLRTEVGGGSAGRASLTRHTAALRDEMASSSEATPRGSNQRPAPLERVSHLEDPHDVATRRSPKMEVSHLVSEEPTPKPKGEAASSARKAKEMIERLESELQKEKKRVLEKMTHLLDEQGKNQQLRDRVEALEAQLAAKDDETNNRLLEAARKQEEQSDTDQAARVNALEEQARAQEAKIARLEEQARAQEAKSARLKRDKDQLKTALKQLKSAASSPSNQHSDAQDSTVLRTELDALNRRLHDFLAKVERWKSNSKETMGGCDKKTGLPALLEQVWLEFPQFPGVSSKGDLSPTTQRASTSGADEQADAVLFLKKRLRQREDELRQTHVKYVELKEICARQCVRETDMQNFINEHRLRGNLVIRKSSGTKPNGGDNNQEQPQDDRQDAQRRSAKLKMISSRGTNTPALDDERGDDEEAFVNDEYSDNQDDNEEEEEDYEYPVRAPKVFVQVGREGVYEHASPSNSAVAQRLAVDRSRSKRKAQLKQQQQPQRVERIRLTPSSSLAQRYERVPTPTTNSARRKKSGHQPLPHHSSQPHQPMLGECPPGCGSRLSFTRRKTPSTAARAKPVKRPVVTTASKGAIGVIRPWM